MAVCSHHRILLCQIWWWQSTLLLLPRLRMNDEELASDPLFNAICIDDLE
jgi:hypothetical protein